ncbi:MAG: AAA-associated domain-containing protein [Chloroflexi bacterium]|nr:AAA-associated domain-containing protein [Chloroflexota bacterium]
MQPAAAQAQETILAARNVKKFYTGKDQRILVLDDITLELHAGELVALLGPSGSGKSTLLRILAGLVSPSEGQVILHNERLVGANPNVSIVFQSFALYPWLTVVENVELGLLAKDFDRTERRRRALAAIDLIGLDGFEDAYPKELSGGMKQRVGFARALVVEPEALFMDEPFSALDVLTAQNLREQLLDLWSERSMPTRAILMVTHNIDEAVSMADRLVVLAADPGRIRADLPGLPLAARRERGPEHTALVDALFRLMTSPHAAVEDILPSARPGQAPAHERPYQVLPHVAIGDLSGLLSHIARQGGREDLYQVARELQLEVDDLLPLVEALDILGLGEAQEGDALLTDIGRMFADADVLEEKEIFQRQALENVALIRRIVHDLEASPDRSFHEDALLEQLEQHFSPPEARRQLDTAIDWGRYAELFAYDDDSGEFYFEDEEPAREPPEEVRTRE